MSSSQSSSHPSQILLDQMDFQSNGPFVVDFTDLLTPNNDNAIVAYYPGNARESLPPLWRTQSGRILVRSDVDTTTSTTATSTNCNNIALERLEQALVEQVSHNVMPKLVLKAVLEEALHDLISSVSTNENSTTVSTTTTTRATTSTSSSTNPPLYYSHSPSAYLHPPVLRQDDTTNTSTSTFTGYSPISLLQRIKAGCGLAFHYNQELENYNAFHNNVEMEADSRRSRRLAPPTLPQAPNVLVKGGRICDYFSNEYGKDEASVEEQENDDAPANDASMEVPAANDVPMEQQQDDDELAVDEDGYKVEESEEEEDKQDDDDDFDPQDESNEEEEEESLEADDDDEELVESSSEEESSDDEQQDEDEALDEHELIHNNPHFCPTLHTVLDYMGRRGKHMTTAHIQEAIVLLLKEGVSIPASCRMDQLVLHHAENKGVASHLSPSTPRVVLECTTGETWKQLSQYDIHNFQKCRFVWKLVRDATQEELYDENQQLLEEHYYAELQYKKEKAWATWRYKGIQTGYAVWPQWTEAVTVWRKEASQQVGNGSSVAVAAASVEQQANAPAASATTATATTSTAENDDLALAQAMDEEQQNTTTTGRRRTRRAGDAATVFYGGQTGMSHKQLMDTIVRMAYQQPFQTMVALQSLVAEESSNPLHRIRVALGKLLWKTNQVTRVRVNSVWTDLPLWNVLVGKKQALLQVPAQLKADEKEEEPSSKNMPTEENLKHLEVLTEYIRNLHKTELELRSLILRHLTTTPIVTVATAADERAGSQEAVDAPDFEGTRHASLDWSTTGHDLLNQVIFRPSFLESSDSPECTWYKIKDYVPSVPMSAVEEEARPEGRPREVFGKEPLAMEKRMRFRAYPVTEEGVDLGEGAILVLTEGQVHAGIKAAKLERETEAAAKASKEHPFAIGAGSNITLQSQDEAVPNQHCQVAGYDTVPLENSEEPGELEHRILLLPQALESSDSTIAFWAIANLDENGILTCRPVGSATSYKILQSDCDSTSSAFQECHGIIEFLLSQTHSNIFAEPVDPVALKIPTYFSVVKQPMDISTVSSNLEKGLYSKIPPGQNVGRSPVARMLNGPFKDDVVRIFDNAMLFNPPDDWIHHTAASMKRTVLKKIEQASRDADDVSRSCSPRKKSSMYVDEDSDVDMYDYESDRDDEEYGRRTERKRKRIRARDDFSTAAMEAPVALRKTLSESTGLRGAFSSLPINSEAAGYSLSSEWKCRHRKESPPEETKQDAEELKRKQEMEELLMLHRHVEEEERAGLRRSSRAHPMTVSNGNATPASAPNDFEYFLTEGILPPIGDEETDALLRKSADSRSQVEAQRESLHEVYFAKLYQQLSKFLQPIDKDYGTYTNSSFPPFLGRVIPSLAPDKLEDVTWEVRASYVLPAIHWVLRGLVQSGHLAEVDTDVLLTNDIYYSDDSQQPFDILDMKEMQRRKRATLAGEEEQESEEEVEMSEYEKLRAERVARNAERLKALGLA